MSRHSATSAAQPIRVALVTPGYPPDTGGVEGYVSRLAIALSELGHEPTVLTQVDRNTVSRGVHYRNERGVGVYRFARPTRHPDIPAPALVTATRGRRAAFDIVHTHSYHQLPALGIALSERNLPIVTTLHYNGEGRTPLRRVAHRAYRPLGRLLIRRSGEVIALSASERTRVQDLAGTRTPITVILPAIERPPDVDPMPTLGRTILAAGRLERGKRFDVLIDALRYLPADSGLVLAGAGPEAARLRAHAARLKLADRVHLPGWLDGEALARWRVTATVFATASERECFQISLAEAIACGLPAVASAIPAHRDAAALPNARVSLVTGDDPRAWADALAACLDQPRAQPVRFCTWREVAREVASVYRRVIGTSIAPRRDTGTALRTRMDAPRKEIPR